MGKRGRQVAAAVDDFECYRLTQDLCRLRPVTHCVSTSQPTASVVWDDIRSFFLTEETRFVLGVSTDEKETTQISRQTDAIIADKATDEASQEGLQKSSSSSCSTKWWIKSTSTAALPEAGDDKIKSREPGSVPETISRMAGLPENVTLDRIVDVDPNGALLLVTGEIALEEQSSVAVAVSTNESTAEHRAEPVSAKKTRKSRGGVFVLAKQEQRIESEKEHFSFACEISLQEEDDAEKCTESSITLGEATMNKKQGEDLYDRFRLTRVKQGLLRHQVSADLCCISLVDQDDTLRTVAFSLRGDRVTTNKDTDQSSPGRTSTWPKLFAKELLFVTPDACSENEMVPKVLGFGRKSSRTWELMARHERSHAVIWELEMGVGESGSGEFRLHRRSEDVCPGIASICDSRGGRFRRLFFNRSFLTLVDEVGKQQDVDDYADEQEDQQVQDTANKVASSLSSSSFSRRLTRPVALSIFPFVPTLKLGEKSLRIAATEAVNAFATSSAQDDGVDLAVSIVSSSSAVIKTTSSTNVTTTTTPTPSSFGSLSIDSSKAVVDAIELGSPNGTDDGLLSNGMSKQALLAFLNRMEE
ncbi:unnamed protein product [Amoebophrya sp. A25]|nr:unnamed protein product [Amoebophrya sp. A25]|eukprot:GSA25T00015694001.1